MGFYRLLLSFCVFYAHMAGGPWGYNTGVIAVISFYILSGFVMASLINKYYSDRTEVFYFYVDRICRIFPQYLFYLILTLLLNYFYHFQSSFLEHLTYKNILLNILIFPNNFQFIIDNYSVIIPPSWSLGLELFFYALFPWIVYNKVKSRQIIYVISIGIFTLAYLGILNTLLFGYILTPGTLFMFLCGSCLDSNFIIYKRIIVLTWSFLLCLFTLLFFNDNLYQLSYNKEVLLGALIGLPCVFFLRKVEFPPLLKAIDILMGNLSYGVFLNHFLVLWLCHHYNLPWHFLILLSLIFAWISYEFIEKPVIHFRHKIRNKLK